MYHKCFTAFVILNAVLLYGAGGVLPGSGTEVDPYLIEDLADFETFADEGNAVKYWSEGVCTKLTCDIDLEGKVYDNAVIASGDFEGNSESKNFGLEFPVGFYAGAFDGGGHCILNFRINKLGSESNPIRGLFGIMSGERAEIKNLTVNDVIIEGCWLGGVLCGYIVNGSTIRNCHVSGTITYLAMYTGGLCGVIGPLCSILDSTANCIIQLDKSEEGSTGIGGLIGVNLFGCIKGCNSMGSITTGDECGEGRFFGFAGVFPPIWSSGIGGLCGGNAGVISDSNSTVSIATGDESSNIGGFCGYNAGEISCSYSSGSVSAGDSSTHIGGFCATIAHDLLEVGGAFKLVEESELFEEIKFTPVKQCYSTGNVKTGNNSEGVGGFCGSIEDYDGKFLIEYSYSTGTVNVGMESECIGGFCGYNDEVKILHSSSTASIAFGKRSSKIGGLVGQNLGQISNCSSECILSSEDDAEGIGGLCGVNGDFDTSQLTPYLKNCNSNCNIKVSNNASGVGGLCGSNIEGIIENCYSNGAVVSGDKSNDIGGLCGINITDFISEDVNEENWRSICSKIITSYSACRVTAGDESNDVGGFCGSNAVGIIEKCYSTGSVNVGVDCGDEGVIPFAEGGGIPYARDVGGFCGGNSGEIIHSYSSCLVSANDDSTYTGGFCGASLSDAEEWDEVFLNCFWDIEVSGMEISAGGEGKTTAQMKSRETYESSGWDFSGSQEKPAIWVIFEDRYPQLTAFADPAIEEKTNFHWLAVPLALGAILIAILVKLAKSKNTG
jgi:hypothetical protein